MIDRSRLQQAYEKARFQLLAERSPAGHWTGQLSTSALSTATAVSALALVQRHEAATSNLATAAERERQATFERLILGGLNWLCSHQNADGGWGDTDLSPSNIATTLLALAAFHLTGIPPGQKERLERAQAYVKAAGGIPGLRRRYGRDKTFAVPILANCALAGMVDWQEVAALPFEWACLPQSWYRFARLPVVSYAIPALVAVGQAKYFHQPPWNPLARYVRRRAVTPSLAVLARMQPESGGYLEATPLTSFVVMCLAATGRVTHEVTQKGTEFLVNSVRPDGSWPIDTNLATWNTTLALNALAAGGDDLASFELLPWLLECQNREPHPFTGAAPGGWAWTDLSGGVPDTDDTPGALLALAAIARSPECSDHDQHRLRGAAEAGVHWLLGMQNGDGGWPTFCRGWGLLPFDRSGADLTAHALRALWAWRHESYALRDSPAFERGFAYLRRQQKPNGSWLPLWFGNHSEPDEANPVYGTAKVLLAYRDCGRHEGPEYRRGREFLRVQQNADGGWGGEREGGPGSLRRSSVEETALAIEALLGPFAGDEKRAPAFRGKLDPHLAKGIEWLVTAVEQDFFRKPFPIGFYFARLWYYEALYPLTFTVGALGRALGLAWPEPLPTDRPERASVWQE